MLNRFRRFAAVPMLTLLLGAMLVCPPNRAAAQQKNMSFDIFSGLVFGFRDISYTRQYDLYISLTPGFKWQFNDQYYRQYYNRR